MTIFTDGFYNYIRYRDLPRRAQTPGFHLQYRKEGRKVEGRREGRKKITNERRKRERRKEVRKAWLSALFIEEERISLLWFLIWEICTAPMQNIFLKRKKYT